MFTDVSQAPGTELETVGVTLMFVMRDRGEEGREEAGREEKRERKVERKKKREQTG